MATAACLPIAADRAGPCVRTIFFKGLDLTGVTLALEARLNPETPGQASIALGMGDTANAEGLRLVDVTVADGMPTSQVVLRINETTMKDATKVPYSGELGSSSVLYYDLVGIFGQDKRRLVYGTLSAVPTVYGMDAAPANRPPGGTASTTGAWASASLTFTDDSVTVTIDGADLIGSIAAGATVQADRAEAASDKATEALSSALRAIIPEATATLASPENGEQPNPNDVYLAFAPTYSAADFTTGSLIHFRLPARTTGNVRLFSPFFGWSTMSDWSGSVLAGNSYQQGEYIIAERYSPGNTWVVISRSEAMRRAMLPQVVRAVAGGTPNAIVAAYDQELVVLGAAAGPLVMLQAGAAYNTGPVTIDGYAVRGPVGQPMQGGEIGGSRAVLLMWEGSTANSFRLLNPAPKVETAEAVDPLAAFRQPLVDVPLGQNPSTGTIIPLSRAIIGRGSSTSTDKAGRDPGVYEGPSPLDYLVGRLNELALGAQYQAMNWGHGGHVVIQAPGQYQEAVDALPSGAPIPQFIYDNFGMNDGKPGNFNAQEVAGNLAIRLYYYQDCRAHAAAGRTLILSTEVHPHRGRAAPSMDGVAQFWPVAKPAPVAPEDMFPKASQSLIVKDWSGSGVRVVGDVRYGIVNDLIRDVARRINAEFPGRVILIDKERAGFRNVIEPNTVAPGTVDWTGYDVMYPGSEVYHPGGVGHRQSEGRCIDQLVTAIRGGTGAKWWFDGC
jgi:hypothetical protein